MGGAADLVLYSTRVGPCESGVGTFGRSENAADGIVRWKEQFIEKHMVRCTGYFDVYNLYNRRFDIP